MKNIVACFLVVCFSLSLTACSQKAERLLLAGSGWNKIVIIDKESKAIEWEYPLERGWECNSVAATKSGDILLSYRRGARLIDQEKNTIWDWKAEEGCEIQTAKVLPDGKIMLGQCGVPATVFILNADGTLYNKTSVDIPLERPHSQFRQINRNKEGNYMIPVMGLRAVWEVSPEGKMLKSVEVPGNPFAVAQLPNKNWMVACGDASRYVELDFASGEIVRQVEKNSLEDITLFFVAEILPTRQGGMYICNWQGHDRTAVDSHSPQVFELDSSGKMVWSLNDNESFGMISAICPIR